MSDNLQQSDEVRGKDTVSKPLSDHPDTESVDTDEEGVSENPQKNAEVPSLTDRLLEKDEELHALNDKYLRLAAEFDNYKRRVQRDQQDTIRFANEKLFKDLLPTLDNLERALQSGREQGRIEGLLEGVDLTYKHFLDTLQKMGIKQVSSVGEVFDPAKHQAVGQVESTTIPENVIVDEYQKGYFVHDRILRPAMVTVAKAKTEPGDEEAQESKEGAEA
ncbi:MAG: nucleotide exchange factor GrpE [Nitrospira sp. SB0677_bin_15]|nr:nucleotide exchange factor GrpE [Nitrospira sp. SB0661_bin_20]MYG40400.1 nucleotide exchange factor GrpE [Nitrospira sp. SB0677_bin_15]MYH03165.1 nucleotide exchange factor GrpE [Nitrospira sp. SB0675_bin_23]MYJ23916.1 nucleotide exchange factor GrpE [Nitrospira sp. SB0673_bin_12]